jgi:serine/threonine-protein kinase
MAAFLSDKRLPDVLGATPPRPTPTDIFSAKTMEIPSELDALFLSCLNHAPESRPAMSTIRDIIARHLLKDKHQALAVFNDTPQYLNHSKRKISLSLPNIGAIEIEYNSLDFFVKSKSGEVLVNNRAIQTNEVIPGSCVVALGYSCRPSRERAYITFDISHPEVVL